MKKDQHFMVDKKALERIVSLANISRQEAVLEIGPGKGALTGLLMKKTKHLTAVEIDKNLASLLRVKFPGLEVVNQNVLEYLKGRKSIGKIVSNLPYSICEPLIRPLAHVEFKEAVLTVPKGFYFRVIGGKTRLSLFFQAFFSIEKLMEVPKEAFHPRPRTSSLVVMIAPKKSSSFEKFLFSHEKMKLKNLLVEWLVFSKKMTKKQAKTEAVKALKGIKTIYAIQEKTAKETNLNELCQIIKNFKIGSF